MRGRNHSVERTCLGCRQTDARPNLLRLAARADEVFIDRDGRQPGRGGYLHRNHGCLKKFVAAKVKEFRSLKCAITHEQRRDLVRQIEELLGGAVG